MLQEQDYEEEWLTPAWTEMAKRSDPGRMPRKIGASTLVCNLDTFPVLVRQMLQVGVGQRSERWPDSHGAPNSPSSSRQRAKPTGFSAAETISLTPMV